MGSRVAVAEALHVEGSFAEAYELWTAVARAVSDPDPALKAAASAISAGRNADGATWLCEFARRGGDADETFYTAAHVLLALGHWSRALRVLRGAHRFRDGHGPEWTLYGRVIACRPGGTSDAVAMFEIAAEARDPHAVVNLVSLKMLTIDREAAIRLLTVASATPMFEPFVLMHRLAARFDFGGRPGRFITQAHFRSDVRLPSGGESKKIPVHRNVPSRLAKVSDATFRDPSVANECPSAGGSTSRILRFQATSVRSRDRWIDESLRVFNQNATSDLNLPHSYRASALSIVRGLRSDPLVWPSLLIIEDIQDDAERYAAVVRGAFFLWELRRKLGLAAFTSALLMASDLAKDDELSTFSFSAVVSHCAGSSVAWMFRQTVIASAVLSFAARFEDLVESSRGFVLTFSAYCADSAVPSMPVLYRVHLVNGLAVDELVDLRLGIHDVSIELHSLPISIQPDPDAEWYAETARTSVPHELLACSEARS